jgi:hypothetical protein
LAETWYCCFDFEIYEDWISNFQFAENGEQMINGWTGKVREELSGRGTIVNRTGVLA